MLPIACGFAPGATTVLPLMAAFGRIQPLAGLWHEAQACLLPEMDSGSKKICFPSNSRGVSAPARTGQRNNGMATTKATSKDFGCKFLIILSGSVVQSGDQGCGSCHSIWCSSYFF